MSDPSTSLYTLESSVLPDKTTVAAFRCREGLSSLYELHVGVLLSGGEIDLEAARGLAATFTVQSGSDDALRYHAMIAEASMRHVWKGFALYELVLVPKVWVLTLSHYSRVFVDRSVPEIIEVILEAGGLGAADYELRLQGDHEPHFHTCQYKESRWAFLERLMEREGLYYFFEQGEAAEKLIITDHHSFHAPLRTSSVRYVPLSGADHALSGEAFSTFTSRSRAVPGAIKLRDFDYLNPALDVAAEQTAWDASAAAQVHHGEHDFRGAAAGAPKATAMAESFKAAQLTFQAAGRAFGLRSGYRFTLDEHPIDSINTDYLAVRVLHSGRQAADDLVAQLMGISHPSDYAVEVEAITSAAQWRCPRRTPIPRVASVERAFVDGPADSEYAQIDEHGRYKVKLHFDVDDSERWDGEASTWIRMLQPHGGSVEGFHFPLRKNTEVLILFLGGDPDRPVIAGAVPNATQPSPVTSKNNTQNVIRTGADNSITLDDKAGHEWIEISTPNHDTFIYMGDPRDYSAGDTFDPNKTAGAAAPDSAQVPGTYITGTRGSLYQDVGENRTEYVGGMLDVTVKGWVSEQYQEGQFTKISGGDRVIDITGALWEQATGQVTEIYQAGQKSDVTGNWDVTVSGQTNLKTNFWGNTVDAHTQITTGTYQLKSGDTGMYCGKTDIGFGSTSIGIGPLTGSFASVSLDIPGGVKITTPNWDVSNPNQDWKSAKINVLGSDITWNAGKAIEIVGISVGATGLKGETCGVSVSYTGAECKNEPSQITTAGMKAATGAVTSWLKGLISLG